MRLGDCGKIKNIATKVLNKITKDQKHRKLGVRTPLFKKQKEKIKTKKIGALINSLQ